jgi:hypothetical protein
MPLRTKPRWQLQTARLLGLNHVPCLINHHNGHAGAALHHAQGQPSIALTSTMYLTTAYEWSVTKTSPDTSISIQQGSSGTASYTVAFTRTSNDIPTYTVSSSNVQQQANTSASSRSSTHGPINHQNAV